MDDFPWGKVIKTHAIGDYKIIEYAERGASNHPTHAGKPTGRHLFHCDHYSYESLDHALIGIIARKHDGVNTRADVYFLRMIGI